jgi:hypothetical protein
MRRAITALGALAAAAAISACGSATARPADQVVKPATVSCFPVSGRAYLTSPGAGVAAVNGCTISIRPVYPLSTGEAVVTVTAPDGSTGSYTASRRG